MLLRSKLEAIAAARAAFARCQFDEAGCSLGLRRLRAYRKEWDESRGVWKDRPRHDEASQGADTFLTFACSNYTPASALRPGSGVSVGLSDRDPGELARSR